MVNARKIIVFFFVAILFFYLLKLFWFTKRNWKSRNHTFGVLICGLSFLTIATFLDMISFMINFRFIYESISIFFTLGAITYVIGVILWSDYTKKMIERLQKIALTDYMTGVLNRKGIEEIYDIFMEGGKYFYIMVCDLDGTKRINDIFGHLEGDKYIIRTTKIISEVIGGKGNISRSGGDEFIILLEYMDVQELTKTISKIKQSVCEIFPEQNSGVSLGHALFPKDGATFEELVKIADKNMYEDKKRLSKNKR